jgi:Cation efflux family
MGERVSTRGTVLIAGAANLLVGVIKLAAGILVGSSAMLAETAHSAADTLNQGLLLASLRRGERPADSRHPFGYGQERYFWSLLAAFGIFIAGAGFSVFEGVLALRHGNSENPLIAYVVPTRPRTSPTGLTGGCPTGCRSSRTSSSTPPRRRPGNTASRPDPDVSPRVVPAAPRTRGRRACRRRGR